LLNHYVWVALCLFGGSVANAVVGKLLGPLVALLVGSGALFLFSLVIAPYLIVDCLPTKVEGSDDEKRLVRRERSAWARRCVDARAFQYQLLLVALNGLVFAGLTAGSWLPFLAPAVILFQMRLGVQADAMGSSMAEQPHSVLLGLLAGVPSVVLFIYAFVTGSFTGVYLL